MKQTVKPVRERIKIVCAKDGCPRSRMVDREDTDPTNAVTMKILCPWHEDSEFETPAYYDKDGNELLNDPEEDV